MTLPTPSHTSVPWLSRWAAWCNSSRVLIGALVGGLAAVFALASQTPTSATDIFWVELSFTPEVFTHNLRGWVGACASCPEPPVLTGGGFTTFRRNIAIDFLLIITYSIFLSGAYLWLDRANGRKGDGARASTASPELPSMTRVVLGVVLVAAALDIVENLLLLRLVAARAGRLTPDLFPPGLVYAMSAVSALKWSALGIVAALVGRAILSGERAEILRLSRYSLLSLVVGTGVLIFTGQGRDLVSALADGPSHRLVAFAVALGVWGTSVWYWSRIVLDGAYDSRRAANGGAGTYPPLASHLPRVLGVLTLLLPIFPIWRASAQHDHRRWILMGVCIGLSLAFFVVVWRRRAWMTRATRGARLAFTTAAITASVALRVAVCALVASLALFVIFVFAPLYAGGWLGTIAIFFIAAANTVFFGSVVVFVTRTFGWPIELLAFSCAALFSLWNDNHRVTPLTATDWQRKPTLSAQFESWAKELRALPHVEQHPGAADVPVFVIAAEGGGIRAAYWTATVLAALNDATDQRFAHHVFAVSGISGGSLGAALHSAMRRDAPSAAMRATLRKMLQPGYLAPVVAKTVTGDFLQWFLPFPMPAFDRSTAMEDGFAASYEREVGRAAGRENPLTRPFLEFQPSARQGVPALVLSATAVETGGRVITAPFQWLATDLPDAIDYHRFAGHDPSLAGAVHNSARFAYVSPAGLVPSSSGAPAMHVIDGGYFDPTGIDTLLDLTRALSPLATAAGMRIVPIFIGNTPPPVGCAPGRCRPDGGSAARDTPTSGGPPPSPYAGNLQPVEMLGEFFAPVRGVLRARVAHGRLAEERLRPLPDALSFLLCDPSAIPGKNLTADAAEQIDPPLGWEISPRMAARLDTLWTHCHGQSTRVDLVRTHLGLLPHVNPS